MCDWLYIFIYRREKGTRRRTHKGGKKGPKHTESKPIEKVFLEYDGERKRVCAGVKTWCKNEEIWVERDESVCFSLFWFFIFIFSNSPWRRILYTAFKDSMRYQEEKWVVLSLSRRLKKSPLSQWCRIKMIEEWSGKTWEQMFCCWTFSERDASFFYFFLHGIFVKWKILFLEKRTVICLNHSRFFYFFIFHILLSWVLSSESYESYKSK